jgi:hypothetical protein
MPCKTMVEIHNNWAVFRDCCKGKGVTGLRQLWLYFCIVKYYNIFIIVKKIGKNRDLKDFEQNFH